MDALSKELETVSKTIRRKMFEYMLSENVYHIGGDLSCVEILVYIFFYCMKEQNLKEKERDNFILSKGHCAYTLYVILAKLGYFDYSLLKTYRTINSPLQGHPDSRKLDLLDFSSGSLGQGLSVGIGMALAKNIYKKSDNIYVLLGDGELEEGQIWEAAISGSKYNVNNIVALVDYNRLQVDGDTSEYIGSAEELRDKWKAFGWNAVIVEDGHDFKEIHMVMHDIFFDKSKPKVVIFKTVKGKGVSFMENKKQWHSCKMDNQIIKKCLEELRDDDF